MAQHGSQDGALYSCVAESPSGAGSQPSLYLSGWKRFIPSCNQVSKPCLVDASEQPLLSVVLITIIWLVCYLI